MWTHEPRPAGPTTGRLLLPPHYFVLQRKPVRVRPRLQQTSGGGIVDISGERLLYNKDDLLNPSILSFGDPSVDWVDFMAPELAQPS